MIVGISGKMGSGKDTISDYLVRKFLGRKVAFADKLKELLVELFNLEKGQDGRRDTIQKVGGFMRSIDEDVWINFVINSHNTDEFLIVSDVRHVNEAKAI